MLQFRPSLLPPGRAAKRLGAPLSEFRGFQLAVPNQPWRSILAMAFDC